MQINMEDTAGHETAHKLAHRADKANFPLQKPLRFERADYCQKGIGKNLLNR